MHYKDGTPARLGDQVKGNTYNVQGPIVGTLVGITPGRDACNCRVAMVRVAAAGKVDPLSTSLVRYDGVSVLHRSEPEGVLALTAKVDSSQLDWLELVHRPPLLEGAVS